MGVGNRAQVEPVKAAPGSKWLRVPGLLGLLSYSKGYREPQKLKEE